MAFRMAASKRTEGDGMENISESLTEKSKVLETDRNETVPLLDSCSVVDGPPLKSTGSKSVATSGLICLKPVVPQRKASSSSISSQKVKEPKFVPFEPYKAAVRPIIPTKKLGSHKNKIFVTGRPRGFSSSSDQTESDVKVVTKIEEGEEFVKLRLENDELEKQLKLQVQINGELKNLLVAAVGEDMETRVNCLAEDKQHLAQKLINTARNLSTHQEQVEWLASQCEVWRSKFLASSVMVEELARWKASLSHKISEYENIVRKILDERKQVQKSLLTLYSSLAMLRDNFDLLNKRTTPKSTNIVDLSAECSSVANGLIIQLLGGGKTPEVDQTIQGLPHFTEAEKAADHMLKHPHLISLIGEPDAACNAVMGAAVALHSQLYHHNNPPRIACCPQCTGQIKLV